MLGGSGVGKTCLLLRFFEETFSRAYMSTIGIDFKKKVVKVDHHEKVFYTVWDTAGQERFKSITQTYIGNANIVTIDLTDPEAFKTLKAMIELSKDSQVFG